MMDEPQTEVTDPCGEAPKRLPGAAEQGRCRRCAGRVHLDMQDCGPAVGGIVAPLRARTWAIFRVADDPAERTFCPECDGSGSVWACFHYGEVEAGCPYCGGDGVALIRAVERDHYDPDKSGKPYGLDAEAGEQRG